MIFSSLLILFLWIRSILVLRLFCLFLLSLSQKDNRAFADGNFIEDAIIFHISRVWGKGKFICWREIMTFFFLLLLLPFLVVTFHSHTINIIIFLLCMLWEKKKWLMIPSYIYVNVLYYWCCYFNVEVWESRIGGWGGKKSITIIDFGNLTNCYLHFAQSFSFTHRFPLYTCEKDEKKIHLSISTSKSSRIPLIGIFQMRLIIWCACICNDFW